MTQSIILVLASRCTLSPSNVRNSTDPDADARLQASIAEHGILQNLIGVPVARKTGEYRITAGGRRLACVQRLIWEGKLPEDFTVPVKRLVNANDALELLAGGGGAGRIEPQLSQGNCDESRGN